LLRAILIEEFNESLVKVELEDMLLNLKRLEGGLAEAFRYQTPKDIPL
jgi:hypothetical protein